jgi:uncharacterized protein YceH (UPF0502 family)
MSSESDPAAAGHADPWPVLDIHERRLLGVLVEKAKTTPDAYPMSVNALVTGSNQKSNREPILNLSDLDVEESLARCQQKGLAIKITGGRVVRWRHNLYEAWHVDKVELAVLGELLLRGPQTEGELRTRASRMEPIEDLDSLRAVLRPLVERRLVVYLTPEERRGAVVTHGFHDPQELERLRAYHHSQPAAAPAESPRPPEERGTPPPSAPLMQGLQEAHNEIAALKEQMNALRDALAAMQNDVRALKDALGV